jgi:hypothetical protein
VSTTAFVAAAIAAALQADEATAATLATTVAGKLTKASNLSDLTDAAAARTNLGISAFVQTLLDDANAAAALTTLGISSFIQTLLDDANAGAALTTLGISSFIQTLLDDADAATARATLGVPNIAGDTFTGAITTAGRRSALASRTTTYTLAATDEVIRADASAGAFTLTLPTAVGRAGQTYWVKKIDSSVNAVTIATTSAQTIDAASTWSLGTQYEAVTLISDGANWGVY